MTSYLKFGVFTRLYYPSKDHGILDRYLQWPLWLPHKEYLNGYSVRLGMPPFFLRFLHQMLVGKSAVYWMMVGIGHPVADV
ncbi:platelet-activating factor acetylhydrolase [Trichonephila clavata]|uniref:Platelet-activating factor acetylhydrolase n=1 Tax=Trichonephila clavata TaxID=2740835 RepID=A0A8X6JEQ5_TRICU|nr:platelet-activating factor acetylhydrolase [Trichonephila clavata]